NGDRSGPVAVPHAEVDPVAVVADRAVHDLPRQLIRAAGLGARQQHARLDGLARRAEARIDERAGQQDGHRQRHHEADPTLSRGVHQTPPVSQTVAPASPTTPCPRPDIPPASQARSGEIRIKRETTRAWWRY